VRRLWQHPRTEQGQPAIQAPTRSCLQTLRNQGVARAIRTNEQWERLLNRLKQAHRVATRYENRTVNHLAMLTIAAITLWL